MKAAFANLHAQSWPNEFAGGVGGANHRSQRICGRLDAKEFHARGPGCRQLRSVAKRRVIELIVNLIGCDPGHGVGGYAIADRRVSG